MLIYFKTKTKKKCTPSIVFKLNQIHFNSMLGYAKIMDVIKNVKINQDIL